MSCRSDPVLQRGDKVKCPKKHDIVMTVTSGPEWFIGIGWTLQCMWLPARKKDKRSNYEYQYFDINALVKVEDACEDFPAHWAMW